MKFSHTLATHLTPEWRIQYINYETLKALIQEAVDNAPITLGSDLRLIQNYYAGFDEEFFEECQSELLKIDCFFAEKLAEAKRRYEALKLDLLSRSAGRAMSVVSIHRFTELSKRQRKEFKFAFSELYLSMVLLQNYQTLNYTGFRKILKKHDKLLNSQTGEQWFQEHVEVSAFHRNSELTELIRGTENLFTTHLENGSRPKAMKRLRVPPLSEHEHPWTTFRVGLFLGFLIVLIIVTVVSYYHITLHPNFHETFLRLNRSYLIMTCFLLSIGINIFGWRRVGINHILIFEIDPRSHLSAAHVIEIAAIIGVLWTLSMLGFLYSSYLRTPHLIFPALLLFTLLVLISIPLPTVHASMRTWVLKLMGRVVTAPFHQVGFADFWMGDQLNSLVDCLVDYEYILCFYIRNGSLFDIRDPLECADNDFVFVTIVRCLPAYFRFMQCLRRYRDTRLAFPFLVNALKYATTFPVVICAALANYHSSQFRNFFDNPYVWGYIISRTISTVYCLAWDYLKDFGLFQLSSGENIFLREQILYPKSFYYFAIIENFLLRILWVPAFYLVVIGKVDCYQMGSVQVFLELFRRYIWNYFRLENEHIYNAGMFRAVRDISLTPVDAMDPISLQRMMDEIDGVENRKSK